MATAKKASPRDGDKPRKGARDGEARKTGARDGETPKEGAREGDAAKPARERERGKADGEKPEAR